MSRHWLKSWPQAVAMLPLLAAAARADVTLLLEEPFGAFGGMNPTGHSAVYLSGVCADAPTHLRPCSPGESGIVISRYHRVAGYDWIAIPLIPYLYAVETADQAPSSVNLEEVAALRDTYRRDHLEDLIPDALDGGIPHGDWTQLVGEAYDRTIYTFGLETTPEQDQRLIEALNSRSNQVRFNLLFQNCADFARQVINLYYPRALHRNFAADAGIMTPAQAAKTFVRYGQKHPQLQFSSYVIAQVPGAVPRSKPVRGVLESLMKSKRYAVPLTSIAVLHPLFGGGLVYAWVEGAHFNPKRIAKAKSPLAPRDVTAALRLNGRPSLGAAAFSLVNTE